MKRLKTLLITFACGRVRMFQTVDARGAGKIKRMKKRKQKETRPAGFLTLQRLKTLDLPFICGQARMFQIVQVRGGRKMKSSRKKYKKSPHQTAVASCDLETQRAQFSTLIEKSREEHHQQAFFSVIHLSGKGNEEGVLFIVC